MFSAKTSKFIINNVDSINFSFDGTPFNTRKDQRQRNGSFDFYTNIKLFDEQKKNTPLEQQYLKKTSVI